MTQVAQLFHLIALPLYLGVRHCGLFISHLMNMAVQEGIIFCEGKGVGRGRVWGVEGCGEGKRRAKSYTWSLCQSPGDRETVVPSMSEFCIFSSCVLSCEAV